MPDSNYINPVPPAAGASNKANTPISSLYTAQLIVRRETGEVITLDTPLSENFDMSLGSSYDRPFAKPLAEIGAEAAGANGGDVQLAEQIVRASTGHTTVTKMLSGAVWSSGSIMQLKIPFQIHAQTDARLDVTKKIKSMLELVTPSVSDVGTLKAPGPYMGDVKSIMAGDTSGFTRLGGDDITLIIGRFLIFNPCIITDVAVAFDAQFDSGGQPIAALLNVSFEAYFTTTTEDLEKMFAVF